MQYPICFGQDLAVRGWVRDVTQRIAHDEHVVEALGRKPRASCVCLDAVNMIIAFGGAPHGVIDKIPGIVQNGAPCKTTRTQFQAVATMAPTEVQYPMSRTDREQFADEVNLTASNLFIANRAGVREEIDLVEHCLPPIRVYFHFILGNPALWAGS
jgi:hypothetical protein